MFIEVRDNAVWVLEALAKRGEVAKRELYFLWLVLTFLCLLGSVRCFSRMFESESVVRACDSIQ